MKRTKYIVASLILFFVLLILYVMFFPFLKGNSTAYVYVYPDSGSRNVRAQLDTIARGPQKYGVSLLMAVAQYDKHVKPGRYALSSGESALRFFRNLYRGHQTPVELTIPPVRTLEDLSGFVSYKLMMDSLSLYHALKDSAIMSEYGVDTANAYCLFVPNTYEVYWNVSVKEFLKRMKKESDNFWTSDRLEKARRIPMTPHQVYTLASIVDEETANNSEKPKIAGMYINRLKADMPLQADPTIKFAWKKFGLKRIYQNLLGIRSPYNTYKNTGLPPGPIRVASVKGIDAVLNYEHHDYMYMCAKEDFSGTHNFARTYGEHLRNAAKYTKALNDRQIK